MRAIGRGTAEWAERIGVGGEWDGGESGAIATNAIGPRDGVEVAMDVDAGGEASATAAGRGTAFNRAAALSRALVEARDEIPAFTGDFGQLTCALAGACEASQGALRQVLSEVLQLRADVAAGMARITSG